jgi:hypothetical protein
MIFKIMIRHLQALRLGPSPSGPAGHLPRMTGEASEKGYRSSQTSSRRQPLKMLFTMIVMFFTSGRQQVPPRM